MNNSVESFFEKGYMMSCHDKYTGRMNSDISGKYYELKMTFYEFLISLGITEEFLSEYMPELSLYTEAKMAKINAERIHRSLNQKVSQLSECLESNT